MTRKEYLLKLSALVDNEIHLEQDLRTYTDPSMQAYLKRSLVATQQAIQELHQKYDQLTKQSIQTSEVPV